MTIKYNTFMRLFLTIIITAIASAVAEWFFPWWSMAIATGIVALFSRLRSGEAMLAGFWGIALLWGGFCIYFDSISGHHLTRKLAELFHLPNYITYIIATMLIGGIAGAMPAWAGAHLRKMFRPDSFVAVS